MAKAKYFDPAHVKDRNRQYLKYWAQKNNQLSKNQPYGWSQKGKTNEFMRKQGDRLKANFAKGKIIETSTGRLYNRQWETAYKNYLTRAIDRAKDYNETGELPLFQAVNRVLVGMKPAQFAEFHDWISSRALDQLINPASYGYFDRNDNFVPNEPEQAAHFMNDLYLALKMYMEQTGYGRSLLPKYKKAELMSLYTGNSEDWVLPFRKRKR